MCWPKEVGGDGKNSLFNFIFIEEMEYWGMPYGNLTFTSIGPSITHFGTEEQKKAWLPEVAGGQRILALAATEKRYGWTPDHVQMPAYPDGGDYLLTGTKLFVRDRKHILALDLAKNAG